MNTAIRKTFHHACAALFGLVLIGAPAVSLAQQTAPGLQIPAEAKQAVLEFRDDGEVTLNGKAARLSAASQIRGTSNLIVLSQSLHGKYLARVLLGQDGSIHRAWILASK